MNHLARRGTSTQSTWYRKVKRVGRRQRVHRTGGLGACDALSNVFRVVSLKSSGVSPLPAVPDVGVVAGEDVVVGAGEIAPAG
jgi:hypothetical protein